MTRRRCWQGTLALGAALVAGNALAGVQNAGLFELEGNVADNPSGLPDDWANVYQPPGGYFTSTFINDGVGVAAGTPGFTTDTSYYDQPGAKNDNPLSAWTVVPDDTTPDKDDISFAFAAAYAQGADTYFYFGADRYDPGEGSAQIGFWFFRDNVQFGANGKLTGEHQVGDLLVLADFTNGGEVATVKVYKWIGKVQQNDDPLQLLTEQSGPAGNCATAGANATVCAISNLSGGEDPPWPYKNNDGGGSTYDRLSLFEGGINVSALLPEGVGCFSSFLAQTRSSGSSAESQLKDLALGQFAVCGLEVTKTGDELSKTGDTTNYSVTVHNTGRATLYKQSITDSLLPGGTGNVSAYCGASLAPNDGAAGGTDECTFPYTRVVQAGDPDPLTNTVTAIYKDKSDLTGTAFSASDGHTVNLVQPSITLAKTANKTLIMQGETVDYTITLGNTSSSDTPSLDCTVTDTNLGINKAVPMPFVGGNQDQTQQQQLFSDPDNLSWCTPIMVGSERRWNCTNTARAVCNLSAPIPNQLRKEATRTVQVRPRIVRLSVAKTGDEWSKVSDSVSYSASIHNEGNVPLTITSISDSLASGVGATCLKELAPDDEAPGGVDECSFTYSYTVPAGAPSVLTNTITVAGIDGVGTPASATSSHTVKLIAPSALLDKTCTPQDVPPGSIVSFRIDATNTGVGSLLVDIDDALLSPSKLADDVALQQQGPTCVFGESADDQNDGCLRIERSFQVGSSTVNNTATLSWRLPELYGLANTGTASDDATCTVRQGGATRTLGFWKTHGSDGDRFPPGPTQYGYTCYVATALGFPIDLGWKTLTDCGDVFGAFWGSKAQCSKVVQAQQQGTEQFLAALLNRQAFGTPLSSTCKAIYNPGDCDGNGVVNDADYYCAMVKALKNGDQTTIKKLQAVFACFNESGDGVSIVDGVAVPPADPNGTRNAADGATSCK